MGYVVAHVSKANSGTSGGLTNHIDRTQSKGKVSKNIDESRSHLNFELAEVTGRIDEMINERIKEGYTGTKKIRKDAVTSCRYVVSGSHDDMMKLSDSEVNEWALDNYNYFAKMYGKKNIIRASVHMDETTPHMHLIVVPLTADGRLSAKEYIGNKQKLKQFQTDYWKKVGKKYGLNRGIEGSKATHTDLQEYYNRVNDPIGTHISIPERKFLEGDKKYLERIKKALKPLIFNFEKLQKENKDFKNLGKTLINAKSILNESQSKIDLKIEDAKGNIIEEFKQKDKKVIDAKIIRQINDILSDNSARSYAFGESNWLTLGNRPVAAKTGRRYKAYAGNRDPRSGCDWRHL